MVFVQTLNQFHNATENTKYIEFINSLCNRQPPNNFTIPYLFYTNKLVQKHNGHVFTNTLEPMFIFKTMDINHQSCPPSYKFSNDSSKTVGLHSTINIKKDILIKLHASNYAIFDGLLNGANGILKHQQHIVKKPLYG
jgi:hypothetical protein